MHLLSLLAAETAQTATEVAKPVNAAKDYESIWLVIIAMLLVVILFSYSSRLSNLDKMIQMLNKKVNNLEEAIKKFKNKPKDHTPIFNNKNIMVSGPFNEDNVEDPNDLIDTTPKISRMLDPRVKPKDINKKESDKKE